MRLLPGTEAPVTMSSRVHLSRLVPNGSGLCLQVVLNITNTFDSCFSRWTVGLGLEHQLNELRVAAGLEEEARFRTRARNLHYAQLVQPHVTLLHLALLRALLRL